MKRKLERCFGDDDPCEKAAVWVRCTQFSGDHFYCDKHAKAEPDFGKSDDSYFYWYEIEREKT